MSGALRSGRSARLAAAAGATGLVAAAAVALLAGGRSWHPYLAALVPPLGAALGSSGLLMLHHLTGGRWGWTVRRPLEAGAATLPLLALLFVPVALRLEGLYDWADEQRWEGHAMETRAAWLNPAAFLGRSALYFAVWIALGLALARASRRRDPDATERRPRVLGRLAAGGLVLHVLTVSFAGFDWLASLEAKWYSSVFGLVVVVGQALTALALVTVVAAGAAVLRGVAHEETVRDRMHELGNLLLATVALGAYLSYVQYLIVWSGNLPHHVLWYVERTRGSWGALGATVVALQFALPLAALLFRAVKRDARRLGALAAVVLVARVLESAWFVLPAAERTGPADVAVAAAALVGVGGVWAAAFLRQCRRRLEEATA